MTSYAMLRRAFLHLAATLLLATASPAPGFCESNTYVEQLVARATSLKLHQERYWEVLLHYTKTSSGAGRSRITDPKFFLSPTGRTDPRRELEETLRSFFPPAARDGEATACRFPARFDWLKERLEIDLAQLPPVTCSERDSLFDTVDPKSATLVFPVGHINSPASMFGHTLLRIDGSSRSNLISYAANYAAVTTDANGLVYAWKGIFGMYRGYYSLMPYYLKVKEYSDLEHRDMWEYKLKLTEPEIKKMLAHMWELQNIYSDYYFFDENCSYNLLFLIEAAKPELRLIEKAGIWVLPSDTINITAASQILEPAHYRPSQGTKIMALAAGLGAQARQKAYRLARAADDPATVREMGLSDGQKRKLLDLAAEFLQVRYAHKELEKEPFTKLYLRILGERSRLGSSEEPPVGSVAPAAPESGHRSAKVAPGFGVRRHQAYLELKVQPVYHALLDPDQGYLRGAQVKLLDGALLYNLSRSQLQLKSLHFVDIASLAPRDIFFKPLSWKANFGFDREAMADGRDALLFRINTGGGFSYASPFDGILYLLGELDLNAGNKIRGTVTAGPGISIGDLESINQWWKMHLSLRGVVYKVGDDRLSVKGSWDHNFRLSQNNSLNLEISQEYVNGHGIFEAALFWNRYF